MGYSVGRWEGDTLVVTTAGYNDRTWLDFNGHPHSEALRTTERFHRRDFGHMDFEMTIDDPKTFTKPITFNADKTLVADIELLESICENERVAPHLVGGNGFRLAPLAKYAGTTRSRPDARPWSPSMANRWLIAALRPFRNSPRNGLVARG